MHIVHILNRYSVTASAIDQIKLSLKDNYKVTLIVGACELPEKLDKSLEKLNIIRLEKGFLHFNSFFELIEIVKKINPSILHAHHSRSGFIVALVGKITNIPTIIEDGAQRENYNFAGRVLFTLAEIFSTKVVFVSKAVQNSLSSFENLLISSKKTEVIYYGVDTPLVEDNAKQKIRDKLSIKKDELVMTHTGRMIPVKNQFKIIELFNQYQQLIDKPIKLVLVGDGPLKEKLEEKAKELSIEDKVVFTGLVERDDVYNILSISNYFIMLSYTEGHSVSLLEAMSYGSIPILSEIESFQETVDAHHAFFVSNSKNIELSDMKRLKETLNTIQPKDVINYYQSRYSETKMMQNYYDVYKK